MSLLPSLLRRRSARRPSPPSAAAPPLPLPLPPPPLHPRLLPSLLRRSALTSSSPPRAALASSSPALPPPPPPPPLLRFATAASSPHPSTPPPPRTSSSPIPTYSSSRPPSKSAYIASCSMDKTMRVWEIYKGTCIRVVYGVSSQLCICFHPVNNTALDIGHTGQLIFAGDARGYIYTVSVNSHIGLLSRTHKNKSCKSKSPITSIQYHAFSLVARCPVLLSCAQDGNLYFFSIATDAQGYLTLICSLKLGSRVQRICASFCPLLSLEKGEFIGELEAKLVRMFCS